MPNQDRDVATLANLYRPEQHVSEQSHLAHSAFAPKLSCRHACSKHQQRESAILLKAETWMGRSPSV